MANKGEPGYIYILSNPCFNFLKIGHTAQTPEVRCKQLSRSQAIPKPFRLEYSAHFDDCYTAEIEIHKHIRVSNVGKEFFDMPLRKAINIIKNVYNGVSKPKHLRQLIDKRRS